jgi:hypothetical protein
MSNPIRRFWLENPAGDTWNLTSKTMEDPKGCFMEKPDGLGIRTNIKSFEIENTFFIEEVTTRTQTIGGNLFFKDYQHFKRFVEFIGNVNTETPLRFYYNIGEELEKDWYKEVLIGEIRKGEIDTKTSSLRVPIKFDCLSRWKQDMEVTIEIARTGQSLVYPYVYPYTYGGNNLAVDIDNTGNLPTSCVIRVDGVTDHPLFRIMQGNKIMDQAKYNLMVRAGQQLVVDSSPTTQKAVLITGTGKTSTTPGKRTTPSATS